MHSAKGRPQPNALGAFRPRTISRCPNVEIWKRSLVSAYFETVHYKSAADIAVAMLQSCIEFTENSCSDLRIDNFNSTVAFCIEESHDLASLP